MKTAFFTMSSDEYLYYSIKMESSLKKFHSDIPLIRFRKEDMQRLTGSTKRRWTYAYAALDIVDEYDLLIQIDSDTIVTSALTEALKGNFDIACVHNNSEGGIFKTVLPFEVSLEKYLNAGFVASTNKEFWKEWLEKTIEYGTKYSLYDQDILNQIFYSGKYNAKVLDGKDSRVWYGCSSYGHYPDMYIENGKLMLQKKEVRAIHTAGNGNSKMKLIGASKEVIGYMNYLMTDYDLWNRRGMKQAIELQIEKRKGVNHAPLNNTVQFEQELKQLQKLQSS